jgi:membrane protease YdiL (CAAX protease family)
MGIAVNFGYYPGPVEPGLSKLPAIRINLSLLHQSDFSLLSILDFAIRSLCKTWLWRDRHITPTMKKLVSSGTWIGLVIAFFGGPLIIYLFGLLQPSNGFTDRFVILRELSLFALAALLLIIIIKVEKLGLASVGLHNRHWGKSLLWSLGLMLICFVALLGCLALLYLFGITYGSGEAALQSEQISLWTMTLMVLRAGIIEELFYRGYIIERLEKLTGNWVAFILLPTLIFALFHYKQGVGGILISFVLGLIFAVYYWKTRDLKATIVAHFLVDFIPNVLVPLFENQQGS